MDRRKVALQRQNTEISKQIFPGKEYRGLSPNIHIHASVSNLYIPTIGMPVLLEEICRPILGLYKSLRYMNVEIGAEAALFPEKEYRSGIFSLQWGRLGGWREEEGRWYSGGRDEGEEGEDILCRGGDGGRQRVGGNSGRGGRKGKV
jgi:hypothetical protein